MCALQVLQEDYASAEKLALQILAVATKRNDQVGQITSQSKISQKEVLTALQRVVAIYKKQGKYLEASGLCTEVIQIQKNENNWLGVSGTIVAKGYSLLALKEGMLDLGNIYLLAAQKQASYRQQAEQCFIQSMAVLNERFSSDLVPEVQLQKGNHNVSVF
jgi:tetratricopeptide (TPR) repeat protein